MDEFHPAAFVRQRRMKRVARFLVACSVLGILVPLLAGLFGYDVHIPLLLLMALLVAGIIVDARSDPIVTRQFRGDK